MEIKKLERYGEWNACWEILTTCGRTFDFYPPPSGYSLESWIGSVDEKIIKDGKIFKRCWGDFTIFNNSDESYLEITKILFEISSGKREGGELVHTGFDNDLSLKENIEALG